MPNALARLSLVNWTSSSCREEEEVGGGRGRGQGKEGES